MRSFARDVLVPFALTRAFLAIVGYVAIRALPANPANGDLSTHAWINMWSRWDAFWHLTIAYFGYGYIGGGQSNLAFPPLFAGLMKAGATLFGKDADVDAYLVAGLIVANVALVVALVALRDLVSAEHGGDVARRVVWYLLVFPTTLFLSAVYADSLFLACAAGSFALARRGRWWMAGIAAALAVLTRVYGLALVPALALEYAVRFRRVRPDAASIALPAVAFAGWLAYQQARFGDAFAFMTAQSTWGRRPAAPWDTIADFFDPHALTAASRTPLDLATAALFIALVALSWRVVTAGQALYATLFYAAPLFSGTLQSESRYVLLLFPAFIVLAKPRLGSFVEALLIIASLGVAAYCMALFALRYWVA